MGGGRGSSTRRAVGLGVGLASLREDDLNQVQRVCSQPQILGPATPLAEMLQAARRILSNAQQAVQLAGGGGVLQRDFALGAQLGGGREGRHRRFVKAAQNEFFLAGVGVDVAHGVDARRAGGKAFGVDHELLARHGQAPVGDGAEFGRQAQQGQHTVLAVFANSPSGVAHCICTEPVPLRLSRVGWPMHTETRPEVRACCSAANSEASAWK